MKFTSATALALLSTSGVMAHPEHVSEEVARSEPHLANRSPNKCASAMEKRKGEIKEKRAQALHRRRLEAGHVQAEERAMSSPVKRNTLQYQEIQNTTCALAPDTIWGPYGYVSFAMNT